MKGWPYFLVVKAPIHIVDFRLLHRNVTRILVDGIYLNPGPLQFDGPGADAKKPITLSV